MTFLEIQACNSATQSEILNKILCQTPNLLLVLGSEAYFYTVKLGQPPAPQLVFATAEDQKRYERIKRRKTHKIAVARCRIDVAYLSHALNIVSPSNPLIWLVYNLKTMELTIVPESALADLTDYIYRHGLFRSLVAFNIQFPVLKVGQRKYFADNPKKEKKPAATTDPFPSTTTNSTASAPAAAAASSSNAMRDAKQIPLFSELLISHSRFPNDLLDLHGLRCLEECILQPTFIPGMTVPRTLSFCR